MQFLRKAINQTLKRESVDVSIPEMLDLIQTEILDKVSNSELKELEKGMHKTWVLGVGGGASLRYYPSSGSAVKLCLDFNILTHQLQQISLQDTVNRKEYFIPRGKESATKLQRAVLYRISKSSGVSEASSQKRGNTDKSPNSRNPLKIKKWSSVGILALFAISIVLLLDIPQYRGNDSLEYGGDDLLLAVLKGENTFIMSDTNESVTIFDVSKVGESEFDTPLIPNMLAVVDMDQDGQMEAIVELTNNLDGWRVILRYQGGAVYGYGYHFRGLPRVSTDGLVMASSGADDSDIFRLHFNYNDVTEEYLSAIESETALENWDDIAWDDYSVVYADGPS